MEKLGEQEKKTKNKNEIKLFSRLRLSIDKSINEIKADHRSLAEDLIIFTVGFLLSRCQFVLGARPLGLAFVALLHKGIFPALLGGVIGSLSIGFDGVIFAVAELVVVLLRAAVSASEKREYGSGELFGESLLLRISVGVLGGFLVAVYESLMRGLNEATLLFGLVMIISTPLLTFLLSGICTTGIGFWQVVSGSGDILSIRDCERKEKYDRIFFQMSSLAFLFFISLSFKNVNLLGISFSYVFSALMSLLVAKRFGALRGMAAGFITALPLSGELSVSFALAGLLAGVMIGFGSGYAIVLGGVALCAWSAYSAGLNGLISTLPEYIIAAAIALPMLNRVNETESAKDIGTHRESAEDMVGTMALAYQNDYSGSVDRLADVLQDLAAIIGKYTATPIRLSTEKYRDIVIRVAEKSCAVCNEKGLCAKEGIRPTIKNADYLASLLSEGKKITATDINTDTEFCFLAEKLVEEINREVGREEQESYLRSGIGGASDEYELISRLINQSISGDSAEKTVDSSMNDVLTNVAAESGFDNGVIRVFGNRERRFIMAGEDEDGSKISSFELRKKIESAAGVKLGAPEYFRRGKMTLMECGIRPALKVTFATATDSGSSTEVSGDTAVCFESERNYFYSLISDGMGSGEVARETSRFVGEFIRRSMDIGEAKETLIHMLNHSIRSRLEECSATIDLFELDLLRGGGVFIKSGSPPSYIKRDASIFRIRSHTAPIGLMRSIDTERISVEIKPGDYIFMLSDGIAEIAEDAPWLLLLLGEAPINNLKEYAEHLLCEAKKNGAGGDDMTVTIIRVDSV